MKFFLITTLLLLSGCASSYASKCAEWSHKNTYYELNIGAVDRIDIFRCTSFSAVP